MTETAVASTIDIPATEEFVARNYVMDPMTEDLIRGTELRNGMTVLVEDSFVREDPDLRDPSDYAMKRLLTNSRWCEITKITTSNRILSFIGVYSDGTKHSRTYSEQYCWFVKL